MSERIKIALLVAGPIVCAAGIAIMAGSRAGE